MHTPSTPPPPSPLDSPDSAPLSCLVMARGSCEALEARILELRQRREELASQLKALGNPDEALLPHCSLDVDLELQLDSLTCLLRASIWALEVVDEQIEVVRDLLPEYVKSTFFSYLEGCDS